MSTGKKQAMYVRVRVRKLAVVNFRGNLSRCLSLPRLQRHKTAPRPTTTTFTDRERNKEREREREKSEQGTPSSTYFLTYSRKHKNGNSSRQPSGRAFKNARTA